MPSPVPSIAGRVRRIALIAAMLLCAVLGTGLVPVDARAASEGGAGAAVGDPTARERTAEVELAARYAPVLMLKEQEAACDARGEPYAPIAVDAVLDHPNVVLRQMGNGNAVLQVAPGAADLFGASAGVYLDYPGEALSPGCIYEEDSRRFVERLGVTVYAHVAREADYPDRLALQYWFFWYFNDWNNRHEGDWEGIQLLFEASSVEEALERGPISVAYAQHEGGEVVDWGSETLERDGDHPVVYPSAGSHASYFGSAVYLGRSGAEGFGCDVTTGPSRVVEPSVVVLPDAVDDAADPLAWLGYAGRWGEQRGGPLNGPTGPASKSRWTAPVSWQEELGNRGIEVPTGDAFGVEVIDAFCNIAERGSLLWIDAQRNPIRALLPLFAVGVVGVVLVRRATWVPAVPLPLRQRRSIGQIVTSTARVYRRELPTMAWIGLAFLPIHVAIGLLGALGSGSSGSSGSTDLLGEALAAPSAVFLGGAGATIGQLIVASAVVALLADRDGTRRMVDGGPYRTLQARWRPLLAAVVRAYAIVIGLSLTLIGIPFAIRQGVRYTFVPQAVMVEGRDGGEALDRSKELARGRWWRTAWVVVLLGVLTYSIAMAVGLLVLLLVPGLPFWAFNVVTGAVLALVMPIRATALALLYGDLAARRAGKRSGAAEAVPADVG